MTIKILVLGDVVGTAGRQAVAQCLPALKERWAPDLVVINAENAANGSGLTPALYEKLRAAGVDGMTLGDHAFRKQQIFPVLDREGTIIRPANLSGKARGKGWMRLRVVRDGGQEVSVYVITVLGRLFLPTLPADDPFAAVDRIVAELPEANPIVLVEMHAEATSEKVAMGWHCNGRVAAVYGTHTHVATADARILPREVEGVHVGGLGVGGTGYITDIGMCGPHDSVLGRRVDRVLKFMTTSMPAAFDVAEANPQVNGVFLEIDEGSKRCVQIERVAMAADVGRPPFVAGGS